MLCVKTTPKPDSGGARKSPHTRRTFDGAGGKAREQRCGLRPQLRCSRLTHRLRPALRARLRRLRRARTQAPSLRLSGTLQPLQAPSCLCPIRGPQSPAPRGGAPGSSAGQTRGERGACSCGAGPWRPRRLPHPLTEQRKVGGGHLAVRQVVIVRRRFLVDIVPARQRREERLHTRSRSSRRAALLGRCLHGSHAAHGRAMHACKAWRCAAGGAAWPERSGSLSSARARRYAPGARRLLVICGRDDPCVPPRTASGRAPAGTRRRALALTSAAAPSLALPSLLLCCARPRSLRLRSSSPRRAFASRHRV